MTTTDESAQTPTAVVRALFAAFTARDMNTVRSLMAPEIVWQQAPGMPHGGRWVGFDQIAENVFGRFKNDWEEWRAVPDEFISERNTVVVLGRYVGTPKATGKHVDAGFAHVYRVEAGKIVRFDQHTDTRVLADAVGA
ncbi:MAG: nuclear transport factor 2 family protein [Planctomycetota bacterium]